MMELVGNFLNGRLILDCIPIVTQKPRLIPTDPSIDVLLSDICIGTSAAPTYLPAHYFESTDVAGNVRQFDLLDGGMFANNPASLALAVSMREAMVSEELEELEFLIISVGTGARKSKAAKNYTATGVARWSTPCWLVDCAQSSSPIIEELINSNMDWVRVNFTQLFDLFPGKCHYFRLQEEELEWPTSSMDVSSPENLDNLVAIGEGLLEKRVQTEDLQTHSSMSKSKLKVRDQSTNKEELTRAFGKSFLEHNPEMGVEQDPDLDALPPPSITMVGDLAEITEEAQPGQSQIRENLAVQIPVRTMESPTCEVRIDMPSSATRTPKRANSSLVCSPGGYNNQVSPPSLKGKSSFRNFFPKLGIKSRSHTMDLDKASIQALGGRKLKISRPASLTKLFTPKMKRT
uniref:PNPLA domain-containing protein n=1 Tax=Kalanchoe fedtschenkoi TaxID=63787 RepID=A0A7N0RBA9_KALFE